MDLQRTLGVLIGRVIHGGMTAFTVIEEEKHCSDWLNSSLVRNGFEERDKLRREHQTWLYFVIPATELHLNNPKCAKSVILNKMSSS